MLNEQQSSLNNVKQRSFTLQHLNVQNAGFQKMAYVYILETVQFSYVWNNLTGISNNNKTLLELYKIAVLPILLYRCENWTSLKWHDTRIEIVEIQAFMSLVRYTLQDHTTKLGNKRRTKYRQFK